MDDYTRLWAVGCGSDPAQVLGEGGGTWSDRLVAPELESTVVVLVVDDGLAPDAEALRSSVAQGMGLSAREGFCDSGWQAMDYHVIVARPSEVGSRRWIGPLSLAGERVLYEDVEAWADRVAEALEPSPQRFDFGYRPLATAQSAVALLLGAREPSDDRERALLEALPLDAQWRGLRVLVASARDDESPLDVEAYLPPTEHSGWQLLDYQAVFPSVSSACTVGSSDPTTRIGHWLQGLPLATGLGWPCGREPIEQGALEYRGSVLEYPLRACTGAVQCTHRPIAVDAEGMPACRVLVRSYAPEEPCDPARGWRDPEGGPQLGSDATGAYRLCEIEPLEGEARTACRTQPECPDCPSGYCVAEPDLFDGCSFAERPGLRFVSGAIAPGATVELTCRVDSPR